MIEFIEQLKLLISQNIVASGGLVVLGSSILIGLLWKSYYYIISFLNYLFFVEINFNSNDDSFTPIQNWLFNQTYTKKRCSNLMVRNIYKRRNEKESSDDDDTATQIFIPAYGKHYFLLGWRPVVLTFIKSDDKDWQLREYVNIRIFCLFKKLQFAETIVEESIKIFKTNIYDETFIYTCIDRQSIWSFLLKKKIKQCPILESPNSYNDLVKDVEKFLNSENWYAERGINYKRGYLFAGVPGSGKTSTILSLAQHFHKHIYILNIANAIIDDNKFIELVTSLPKNSFLALEDFEAISLDRSSKNKDTKLVSLSTILNTLDGLFSPEKLVFFITTNHPEKLDEAIKRPGRIDYYKEFSNSNAYQCETILKRFKPDVTPEFTKQFIESYTNKPMSMLESELIKLK